jgi:hypothetical protein
MTRFPSLGDQLADHGVLGGKLALPAGRREGGVSCKAGGG